MQTAIRQDDVSTWVIGRTMLPGGYVVSTCWNPLRFAPAGRLPGTPHHFETRLLARAADFALDDAVTYATEAEARAGHEAFVARIRAQVAA